MKIALVETIEASTNVAKDQMGGYGMNSDMGNSLSARLIRWRKKIGRKTPIMAFGYLSAIFAEKGHDVKVVSNGEIPDADLVIVYGSIVEYNKEIEYIRKLKETMSAKVGVAGTFPTARPDLYAHVADFVVQGEPENAARKIAEGSIPEGIVNSPAVTDLDSLPFPHWEPFPIDRYSYWPIIIAKPFMPMLSSRGCKFTCSYCSYIANGTQWRNRSAQNTIDELEHLVKNFGIRGLFFRDPIFTLVPERTREIVKGIRQVGRGLQWGCETRLDLLKPDLVDHMYDAGCVAINAAIESANPDVLKSTHRNQSFEHFEKIISHCENRGIKVTLFYVFGLPADTKETIWNTIKYARKLNTFLAQFHINTPFPGTLYYEEVKDKIEETNWEKFTSFNPVFRHEHLSKEDLLELRDKAYKSYYFRLPYYRKHIKRFVHETILNM